MKRLLYAGLFFFSTVALADTIPFTLTGYEYWNDEPRANHLAMESFLSQCKDLRARAEELAGDRLVAVTCGTPIPIVSDDAEIAYSSIATVTLNGPPTQIMQTGEISGEEAPTTGEESDAELDQLRKKARASFDTQCEQWISDMKSRFGTSLLVADCGERENAPKGSEGWRYVAHGRVIIAPTVDVVANGAKNKEPSAAKPIILEKSIEQLTRVRDELRAKLKELQEKLQAKAKPEAQASPSPSPSPEPSPSPVPGQVL